MTAGILIAAAALTGCLLEDTYVPPLIPEDAEQIVPYKIEGNTLITEGYELTGAYCDGDVLRTATSSIDEDTVAFRITGSTLTFYPYKDTLESEAVIEWAMSFGRKGPGTGLAGLWSSIGEGYRLVSGALTEAEESRLEEDMKSIARFYAYTRSWLRIADGKLFSYREREHAKLFLSDWNDEFALWPDEDSARYAITVKAVDKNTVELKGRKNGETVLLTFSPDGGITYSSDRPGHASHRFVSDPESCPNQYAPAWYGEFTQANLKAMVPEAGMGLKKSAEIHPKSGKSRLFPFGPLKTEYSLLN